MKPWVKAGTVGGILQIVFTLPIILIYFLPLGAGTLVALCTCCLFLLTYLVPGVLGVYWTPPPLTSNDGIRIGALAGLLATILDSLVTLLLVLIISLAGLNDRYLAQFIPNAQEIIQQSNLGFWFSTGGMLLQTCFSLIFHIVFGVVISVLGAMVYFSVKKNSCSSI
jgi:hypothetical protein